MIHAFPLPPPMPLFLPFLKGVPLFLSLKAKSEKPSLLSSPLLALTLIPTLSIASVGRGSPWPSIQMFPYSTSRNRALGPQMQSGHI